MRTVTTVAEVRAWRRAARSPVGLVPTMGALHAGHLSLVAVARRENTSVAATVFVNPTQFGPNEDLARYPRDLARDRRLLEEAGCDLLFAPSAEEMYPPGAETTVDDGSVALPLEGERRPGHFRGVATVVTKLLCLFRPQLALFGEKDYQQLQIIRALARDLDLGVEIAGMPIVREADGLALSSRNAYLSREERERALALSRALFAARETAAAGTREAAALQAGIEQALARAVDRIDYVEIVHPDTLKRVERADPGSVALVAAYVGKTRLIDNVKLP